MRKRSVKAFLKRHLISILLTVVLFAGIGLLLYPTAADWWNGMHQAKAIVTYVEQIENIEGNWKRPAPAMS